MARSKARTPSGRPRRSRVSLTDASARTIALRFLRAELSRITGSTRTRIPGIDALTSQTLIAEVDSTCRPSDDRSTSSLARPLPQPRHHRWTDPTAQVGTKRQPGRHRLRIAAQTLHKSKTVGAFYRRIELVRPPKPSQPPPATRRHVYRMLKYGEAFVERGQEAYEQQYKERVLRT